jgi:hypothetical protein
MLGAVFADPDAHLAAWSGRHAWNRTRNSGMTARRRAKPVAAAA